MPTKRTRRARKRRTRDLSHLPLILQEYFAPVPPSAPCASEDEYGDVVCAIWDLGCDSPRPALDYARHPYIGDWLRWLEAWRAMKFKPRSSGGSATPPAALPKDAAGGATTT